MSVGIEALIPHRAPMRWIESLVECNDTAAVATTVFSREHFAVIDGQPSGAALIECVAQTVAAALGERARRSGHSANAGIGQTGMLAAVSNFQIHSLIPLGEELRIEVREVKRLGPMLMVAGRISSRERLIAAGELTLYA
jgi:predicted hotdog family 3-hydroxylacyl-ACP dehydratase